MNTTTHNPDSKEQMKAIQLLASNRSQNVKTWTKHTRCIEQIKLAMQKLGDYSSARKCVHNFDTDPEELIKWVWSYQDDILTHLQNQNFSLGTIMNKLCTILVILFPVKQTRDELKKMIKKHKTKSSLTLLASSKETVFSELLYIKFLDVHDKIRKVTQTLKFKQVKSAKQEENWVDWSRIQGITKNLKKEAVNLKVKGQTLSESRFKKLGDYLTLALYTYHPPRRVCDYSNMHIIKEADYLNPKIDLVKHNWLVITKYKKNPNYFVFTSEVQKNRKMHKMFVDKRLNKVLELYLHYSPLKDSIYPMSEAKGGTDNDRCALGLRIIKIIKEYIPDKHITAVNLRTFFRTDWDKKNHPASLEVQNKLASDMGHTYMTAIANYVKVD